VITIRKLRTLPETTRLRKAILLLDGFVQYRTVPDPRYLADLVAVIVELIPDLSEASSRLVLETDPASPDRFFRAVDGLRHEVRAHRNLPVADWDLLPPAGYGPAGAAVLSDLEPETPDSERGPRLQVSLFLESVRSPFNVGSMIRTAASLGLASVFLSPDCPQLDHPRVKRTSRGAETMIEVMTMSPDALPTENRPLIALEPGGEELSGFSFPSQGTLIVGSEELGLSVSTRERADAVVSIPLAGSKGSLNVGVACGIALHAWCVQIRVTDTEA
jgi:TrmH family RNA methyltransferase